MASILRFDNWQNSDGTSIATTDASGNISFAGAGAGKILQVVRSAKTDNFNTTSTSFTDVTGMSVTITPTSTTSAILIVTAFTSAHYGSIDNLRGGYVITDSSDVAITGTENNQVGPTNLTGTGSREFWSQNNLFAYDTPATTSATTYKLRAKTENASTTVRVAGITSPAQMYAFEVAG
jgi:hypothetical protein